MKKQMTAGLIFFAIACVMLFGSIYMWPDLRPMGIFTAFTALAGMTFSAIFLKRQWNTTMYAGSGITALGLFAIFGATSLLPDLRPITTMVCLTLAGLITYYFGFKKSAPTAEIAEKKDAFEISYWIITIALFGISAVLFPMINWSHPKDPAAVMILAFFMALLLIFAKVKKHPGQEQIFIAGVIFVLNFPLVKLYEAGFFGIIGRFYRLFVPFYESFDLQATQIEWTLISLTILFSFVFAVKKVCVSETKNFSLIYFILLPIMAIFLFEMFGLPAGFLAGTTTRSDLLVTDTNAVMSTFGMIFIGTVSYSLFVLFPFWVAPIFAGLWWVFWKPWLLHHPDPKLFTSLQTFLPAATFLFFTGIKRLTLPMIIVMLLAKFRKDK